MINQDNNLPIPAEKRARFEQAMVDIAQTLRELDLNYYLQCSAALLFYNISLGDNYHLDIDMRVLAPGVRTVAAAMGDIVPPEAQTWFGVEDMGRAIIATPHFQFMHNGFEIDIAADMRFIVDNYLDIEVPNSPDWFAEANTFIVGDTEIRVASIEMLLIYYLIIERAKDTGKMDLEKIARIASSPSFNYEKFADLLSRFFSTAGQAALNEIVHNFAARSAVA